MGFTRGRQIRIGIVCAVFIAAVWFLFSLDEYDCWVTWCGPDEAEDLGVLEQPKPVRDIRTINSLNSYSVASENSKSNFVVVIRTYSGFLNATRQLLENLDTQHNLAEHGINIHAVILATDLNSTRLLRAEVEGAQGSYKSSRFRNLKVYFHAFDVSVYSENCCQLSRMCEERQFRPAWDDHLQRRFGGYKPESRRAKRIQFCSLGNNLLHYVLCDAVIRYMSQTVPTSAANSTYLLFTNGDNVYSLDFVWKMVKAMATGIAGTGSGLELDIAMCDYLERGVGLVHSALRINQMDLGATVHRVGSLQRLGGVGFLDAMPPNAWPSHYYAADGEFVQYLVRARGAKWGRVPEVLFTHW